jgi:hypothetical protein
VALPELFLFAGIVIKLLVNKSAEDMEIAAIYFLLVILTLAFDRFIKTF